MGKFEPRCSYKIVLIKKACIQSYFVCSRGLELALHRGKSEINILVKALAQEQKCSSRELTLSQYIYLPKSTNVVQVQCMGSDVRCRRVRSFFGGRVHFKLERTLRQQSLKYIYLCILRKVHPFLLKKETFFCVIKIRNIIWILYYIISLVIASPAEAVQS